MRIGDSTEHNFPVFLQSGLTTFCFRLNKHTQDKVFKMEPEIATNAIPLAMAVWVVDARKSTFFAKTVLFYTLWEIIALECATFK